MNVDLTVYKTSSHFESNSVPSSWFWHLTNTDMASFVTYTQTYDSRHLGWVLG